MRVRFIRPPFARCNVGEIARVKYKTRIGKLLVEKAHEVRKLTIRKLARDIANFFEANYRGFIVRPYYVLYEAGSQFSGERFWVRVLYSVPCRCYWSGFTYMFVFGIAKNFVSAKYWEQHTPVLASYAIAIKRIKNALQQC